MGVAFYSVRFGNQGHQVLKKLVWEAVSGAKKKHTGGKVDFKHFSGVDASADACVFADGCASRQQ